MIYLSCCLYIKLNPSKTERSIKHSGGTVPDNTIHTIKHVQYFTCQCMQELKTLICAINVSKIKLKNKFPQSASNNYMVVHSIHRHVNTLFSIWDMLIYNL